MNYFAGAASIFLCSSCIAGISGLTDHRSANVSLLHYNEPFNIERGYSDVSVDPAADFAGGFTDSLINDGIGLFLESSLSYSSTISEVGFYSTSRASASSVQPDSGFTYASIGFSNQFVFELDSATDFLINAEFESVGADEGGVVQFDRIFNGESIAVYSVEVMNGIQSVNDVITLEAGMYRYSAINWLGIDTIGRDDAGISSLTASVAVIPAPGVLVGLLGFGLMFSRRR